MIYLKIIFALIFTIIFFIELLQEHKNIKATLCIISYMLFVLIVANKNFF